MTKLIIGLGNPDEEYQNTRHNVGFMFLDYLAKKIDANDFAEDKKHNAMISKSKIEKTSVILAKPLSYVNKSGDVVLKLIKNYKLKIENLVVVHDDLDIEFGSFKNSFEKNSGGHKGVESIIKALKTNKFYRLRIGTSVRALLKAREQSDKKRDDFVMDFVLSKFTKMEHEKLKSLFKEASERLLQILG
ncbi:MAG: aminoacyl-tRNA hydrolase [Candidatus Yanofskybacteria bacterium RIFCSPLOWO2_02_FULL_43_10]|uniref:Peptidyl-tRNA hydrolase n=1 Tax=Candidatus Yanofskybacteria bacterium RIFCSPLOWO2_12_FULL_43_11b TaxID=1802710 RepID=A0A1F8H851_9BACT|nr:MAG: aminoacyl-tRNA hydrolase [Candidatus Yanofskybacteria bacterium RIFCSPHIGHO2_01_FULL_43_32]OGN12131.1 MAG: aminoacyl-tRNA hydrolase [Candidatus Yanofskybacteria bacterium RIFCSPHIGHO2_02_FULL_43_12]OGN18259.1 MAG: aminoacyl-tRNA hydrolase [Candidatus Yanofskybacteria bacterium RIFCSPHIGHO2_12_FULL_43_11]OGN25220.1 MAG: aminoacyl-tRNA hydrolase [Candidatus Yanofskybacteria bacterium RIFCSPLOWO2_01_FULL_43_46]OGN29264.1 MAG: aminoacyl-tRNA hydrolase [Candidatus Yanofskybacteria bacterium 